MSDKWRLGQAICPTRTRDLLAAGSLAPPALRSARFARLLAGAAGLGSAPGGPIRAHALANGFALSGRHASAAPRARRCRRFARPCPRRTPLARGRRTQIRERGEQRLLFGLQRVETCLRSYARQILHIDAAARSSL